MADELPFLFGGLGYLLRTGCDANNMALVLAVMGVSVAIGLAFDRLIFGPLSRGSVANKRAWRTAEGFPLARSFRRSAMALCNVRTQQRGPVRLRFAPARMFDEVSAR